MDYLFHHRVCRIGSAGFRWNGSDFVGRLDGPRRVLERRRTLRGQPGGHRQHERLIPVLGLGVKVSGDQVVGRRRPGRYALTSTPRPAPACSDKIDNDNDGKIDAPADPGCSSATDTDETDPPPPPPPLKLTAGKPAALAAPAKAGARFTVAMTVTRSDGKPFTGVGRVHREGWRGDAPGGGPGSRRRRALHDAPPEDGQGQAAVGNDHRQRGDGEGREALRVRDPLTDGGPRPGSSPAAAPLTSAASSSRAASSA